MIETKTRALVLGVGNILLKDEGVGPHVIEELRRESLPGDVELLDGGTQILDTMLSQGPVEKLIIVDSVKTADVPGSIYRFKPEDITEEREVKLSLHQATVIEALKILEFQKKLPKEIIIFGIVPKEMDWGLELSDELKVKVPKLINLIKEEVKC